MSRNLPWHLSLLTPILVILLSGCRPGLPGGFSPEDLAAVLRESPAALLEKVDFTLLREDQFRLLDDETALLLGTALLEADRFGEGRRFLYRLSAQGGTPWRESAEALLVRDLRKRRDWRRLEEFLTNRNRLTSPEGMESLFFQGKDRLLLDTFPSEGTADATLLYYRTAAALRLGGTEGGEALLDLCLRVPGTELFQDLKRDFFPGQEIFPAPVSGRGEEGGPGGTLLRAVRGKEALAAGEWNRALRELEPLLQEVSGPASGLVEDLVLCYRRTGRLDLGAGRFEAAAAGSGAAERYMAAGRLLRWAGRPEKAAELFRKVRAQEVSEEGSDRSLWYLMDSLLSAEPSRAAVIFETYAPLWEDPEYFSDLADRRITGLAESRRWGELDRFSRFLEKQGTPGTISRCLYILARASESGLYRPPAGEEPEVLLRRVAELDPWGYYGWLARMGTGRTDSGGFLPGPAGSGVSDSPAEDCGSDPVFSFLVRYGVVEDALSWHLRDRPPFLQPVREDVLYLARRMQEAGDYLGSLRLLARLPLEGKISRKEWELRYPRGYRELVEELSEPYPYPASLLLGLVREESGFSHDIVSHAGAVGLGQLMTPTAEDVASRMRMETPDLTDPRGNLTLSAWYLDWLMGYVGGVMPSILAYNGGPGRIRRLRDSWRDLPLDLAVEGITVTETRRYGRKVLVSSLYYGYLYYRISPEETILSFFPEL